MRYRANKGGAQPARHPLEYLPPDKAEALVEAADIDQNIKALVVALLKRFG